MPPKLMQLWIQRTKDDDWEKTSVFTTDLVMVYDKIQAMMNVKQWYNMEWRDPDWLNL